MTIETWYVTNSVTERTIDTNRKEILNTTNTLVCVQVRELWVSWFIVPTPSHLLFTEIKGFDRHFFTRSEDGISLVKFKTCFLFLNFSSRTLRPVRSSHSSTIRYSEQGCWIELNNRVDHSPDLGRTRVSPTFNWFRNSIRGPPGLKVSTGLTKF